MNSYNVNADDEEEEEFECYEQGFYKTNRYHLYITQNTWRNKGMKQSILEKELEELKSKLKRLEKRIKEAESNKPKWTFTEDEKAILRNIPENYNWICRDENKELYVYGHKPTKRYRLDYWSNDGYDYEKLEWFEHLFKCIKWSDEEPCEFRKYI